MPELNHIQSLYQDYLSEVARLERERKPGDGLLGMGAGPADAPCHDRFANQLERLLKEIGEENPTPGQVRALLEYIYRAPLENREIPTAYWMLLAVHGLTLGLAERLDGPDAEVLWKDYRKNYPRWERLPVQNQVLSLLDTRRKG